MMQKRLLTLIAATILLVSGGFIGLAIQRLWIPPASIASQVASPARAAVRQNAVHPSPNSGLEAQDTPVTRVFEAVSPSVVTVGAFKRTIVAQPWFDDFFLSPRVRYQNRWQRTPYLGSGFVASEDGHVVTNYHVIEDSESFFVTFADGREVDAKLVDADRYIDVALLQIDLEELEGELPAPLGLAPANELRIGQQVMALGNPFGNLIEDSQPTLTVGYVSALHRTFRPDRQNRRVYQDMIQTDTAINPGNSGGPLVDLHGKVIGVNTFIMSPSGANTGIGFAIPASRVQSFVDEVITYGRQRPLLLDFAFRTVRLRSGQTAVQVLGMESGGAAETAGLEPGDLLLKIDGREVANRDECYLLFASKQVGNQIKLEVLREGSEEAFPLQYTIQEARRD